MICVAAGPEFQMHAKEEQLLKEGYTQVIGPCPGPMEYCRQPEYSGTTWNYKLCWNHPSTSQASSGSTPSGTRD